MAVFPLSSFVILILSAAEFVSGFMKSTFGIYGLYVFGFLEVALCTAISVSMSVEVSDLSFTASKVLFSLAIIADYVALFVDIWWVRDTFSRSAMKIGEDNPTDRHFKFVKANVKELLKQLFFFSFIFIPSIVVSLVTLGQRTSFELFNSEKGLFEVTEVIENKAFNSSFFLCLLGISLLIIATINIFAWQFLDIIPRHESLNLIANLLSFSIGASLLPSAALRASDESLPAYLLITITTLPPILSLFVTFAKDDAIQAS